MATAIHSKRFGETFNSVTIASATASEDLAADAAEVTTNQDAQKAFLQGKHGGTGNSAGPLDIASGGADATFFTNVTGGGPLARATKPDGTSNNSATNRQLQASAFVTSYSVSYDQGTAATYSTAYQYTGAFVRATA